MSQDNNVPVVQDEELTLIYPICAGVDIHKNKVVITIGISQDDGVVRYITKEWKTCFYDDLLDMEAWLQSYNCVNICVEATGKYWVPLFNVLGQTSNVVVVNAYHVKAINGKKTDRIDSKRICHLFKYGSIKDSFIQESVLTCIRTDMRHRRKLVDAKRSEKQRLIDCLIVSNVRLSSVFSDVLGVSCMNIINYMLDNPGVTDFDIKPMVNGKCKSSIEDIKRAIQGGFSEWEIKRIKRLLHHIKYLDTVIEEINLSIDERLNNIYSTQRARELLETLPAGFGECFIQTFITEVSCNVNSWETVDHFISWLGLAPGKNESSDKKRKSKTTPSHKYFKPVLVQAVVSMSMSSEDTYFKYRYYELLSRIGKKRAWIAVGRMVMKSIYYMIKNDEPFDEQRYIQYLTRERLRRTRTPKPTMSDDEFMRLAEERGYTITKKELPLQLSHEQ